MASGSFGKTSSSNGPTSMQKPASTCFHHFQLQHVEHSCWLLETFMVEIAGYVMSWQNKKAPSYTRATCSCLSKARTLNQPCMTGSGTVYKQRTQSQPHFNDPVRSTQPARLVKNRIKFNPVPSCDSRRIATKPTDSNSNTCPAGPIQVRPVVFTRSPTAFSSFTSNVGVEMTRLPQLIEPSKCGIALEAVRKCFDAVKNDRAALK